MTENIAKSENKVILIQLKDKTKFWTKSYQEKKGFLEFSAMSKYRSPSPVVVNRWNVLLIREVFLKV